MSFKAYDGSNEITPEMFRDRLRTLVQSRTYDVKEICKALEVKSPSIYNWIGKKTNRHLRGQDSLIKRWKQLDQLESQPSEMKVSYNSASLEVNSVIVKRHTLDASIDYVVNTLDMKESRLISIMEESETLDKEIKDLRTCLDTLRKLKGGK